MFVIRMAAFTVPMLRFPTRWPRASRAATEWSQCRIRLGCRTWAATQADRKDPRLEPPTQIPSPSVLRPDGRPGRKFQRRQGRLRLHFEQCDVATLERSHANNVCGQRLRSDESGL